MTLPDKGGGENPQDKNSISEQNETSHNKKYKERNAGWPTQTTKTHFSARIPFHFLYLFSFLFDLLHHNVNEHNALVSTQKEKTERHQTSTAAFCIYEQREIIIIIKVGAPLPGAKSVIHVVNTMFCGAEAFLCSQKKRMRNNAPRTYM
jgi:hypothetical protein